MQVWMKVQSSLVVGKHSCRAENLDRNGHPDLTMGEAR